MSRLISGVSLPSAWTQYNTQDPNGFELAHAQLWFDRTYTSASTTVLNFFDQPLATANLFTNIFPYQNSVLVKAIGVYAKTTLRADTVTAPPAAQAGFFTDLANLINDGLLSFKITKKDYGPFSLAKLASGAGVFGYTTSGAVTSNYNYGQVGEPNVSAAFRLSIPFVIPAQTQAIIKMEWPGGPITLTEGNPTLRLYLETIEARPRQ